MPLMDQHQSMLVLKHFLFHVELHVAIWIMIRFRFMIMFAFYITLTAYHTIIVHGSIINEPVLSVIDRYRINARTIVCVCVCVCVDFLLICCLHYFTLHLID